MTRSRMLPLIIVCLLLAVSGGFASEKDVTIDTAFYAPAEDLADLPLLVEGEVENVILLIGDGMGLGHSYLSRVAALGADGRLNLERMPVTGLVNTHSLDNLVTDSAASGTAMSTGRKTGNRIVGQSPDGERFTTIIEKARDHGLATGLAVTARISHATPACFASHNATRDDERGIALELSRSGVDVLLGGGRDYWLPASDRRGKRRDGLDLVAKMSESGYAVVYDREEMNAVRSGRIFGLFRYSFLDSHDTSSDPTLPEMTAKAVELLDKSDRGFFLMVEGSQIDWRGHENDADGIVFETLWFDMAVAEALRFAREDGRTLVIVTADHETGGLTVPEGKLDGSELRAHFSTGQHSGSPVPLYAFGPGALEFTGMMDNTEIHDRLVRLLRLE